MKQLDHKAALELRFDSDAGEGTTVRDYLYALLSTLWHEEEGFSGKRPFGNSGWKYDVWRPLIEAGYVGALEIQSHFGNAPRGTSANERTNGEDENEGWKYR